MALTVDTPSERRRVPDTHRRAAEQRGRHGEVGRTTSSGASRMSCHSLGNLLIRRPGDSSITTSQPAT